MASSLCLSSSAVSAEAALADCDADGDATLAAAVWGAAGWTSCAASGAVIPTATSSTAMVFGWRFMEHSRDALVRDSCHIVSPLRVDRGVVSQGEAGENPPPVRRNSWVPLASCESQD